MANESCSPSGKPSIAFDLDETLIHCYSLPPKNSGITTFPIRIGKNRVYISTRPGLREFLDRIEKIYEVFIFTYSNEKYANKIIDKIAPEIDESHRLCRSSCTDFGGYHVKDLSKLSRPLNKIFLVDDMSCAPEMQLLNLIRIKPYMGETEDMVLSNELLPALEFSSCADDVRGAARQIIAEKNFRSIYMYIV